MPERAQVTDFDALDRFRSQLVLYLAKVKPALEEVTADVFRMRSWVENDQRMHWEHEVKRRRKTLEQAQEALFSARISNLRKETAAEQMAFHRARRAVDEAEEKLRVVKQWKREFDSRVQPLLKQTEKLHTLLSADVPQAIASLGQTLERLAAYAELKAPAMAPDPVAPPTAEAGGEPSGPASGKSASNP